MEKNCSYWHWSIAFIVVCCFFSCNDDSKYGSTSDTFEFTQPVSEPLEFSEEKVLKWDSMSSGGYHPIVKSLDISTIPAQTFDTSNVFKIINPPEEVLFDETKLPSEPFDLAKLPSQSLDVSATVLAPSITSQSASPIQISGKTLDASIFTIPGGMPGRFTGALLYDRNDLLWIGYLDGLYMYDGENLETVVKATGTTNAITAFIQDKHDNIWFMKGNGSINKLDLKKRTISSSNKIQPLFNVGKPFVDADGNFWMFNGIDSSLAVIDPVNFSFKSIDRSHFSNAFPLNCLQDSKHRIWVFTLTTGIKIIDQAAGKIFDASQSQALKIDTVISVVKSADNIFWLGGRKQISAIDPLTSSIRTYGAEQGVTKADFTFQLTFDSTGQLWRSLTNGVQVFDFKNGTSTLLKQPDGLVSEVVISIAQAKHNTTWLGGPDGFGRIRYAAKPTYLLNDIRVISLLEDKKSNLWVASQTGVYIIDSARKKIRLFDKSRGLINDFVQSFSMVGDKIAIATNGGVSMIDPVNNTIANSARKEGIGQDTIYAVISDKRGNLWTTGPRSGVATLNMLSNKLLTADVHSGLSDDNISDVKEDKDGNIWLATSRGGINVINPAKGTVKYLNKQPGLKDTTNRMLCIDSEGRVWMGTDKGIYVADIKNKTMTSITTANGLSNDRVLSLIPYKNAVLAGTSNKVNIVVPPTAGDANAKWEISLLEGSQDLLKGTSSWATDCVTKSGDYLWGDIGITAVHDIRPSVSDAKVHITGITITNRAQHFYDPIKDAHPTSNDSIAKSTSLSVAGLGYADESVYKWDSVSGPYNLPVNLNVPYNNNFLQFQFAEVNNGRSDTIYYRYFLKGIDKVWSDPTTSNRTENYLNLPPGKYVFNVVSKKYDGKWSEPASFHFTISPPWYKSWWAYLLYLLLGAILLRAYIVFRSRKLKRENKVLEEKVSLRTKQLEESIEGLKLTQTQLIQAEKMASLGELTAGIAHEIQNPLNFVNNFSELNKDLIIELKEEIVKGNYDEVKAIADNIETNEEKINYHGKRADSIVKGMLQHSRSSSGQKEMTDVNQLCDEYLRLAYHGLRAKDKSFNASFETNFDDRIEKVSLVPQDIGRVLLNLINNAFYAVSEKRKTAGADYKPTVEVSTKLLSNGNGNRFVEIRVTDNGDGVPESLKDKIFQPFFTTKPTGKGTGLGLSLSYDIIRAHEGQLMLESKAGAGTTFIIKLPA